uniref:Variant surface glycoprotein 1077 n=1 Tax=Trypanosoma brucei TaxID=5691 RepID=M4SZ93_9TRYP|nr:variant surface glycoprotein 1077 [Trypanosoma brucei]
MTHKSVSANRSSILAWTKAGTCIIATALIANAAVNDNAQEFHVFCTLYNLNERKATVRGDIATAVASAIEADLEMLNLTVAEPSWLQDRNGELKDKEGQDNTKQRQEWKSKVDLLDKKGEMTGEVKYQNVTNEATRGAASKALARILTKAAAEKKLYDTTAATAQQLGDDIKKQITDAIFGEGNEAYEKTMMPTNLGDHCKATATAQTAHGNGTAYDFLCLCAARDAAANGRRTQGVTGGQVNDGSATTDGATALATITGACKMPANTGELTANEIEHALNRFYSLLGRQTNTLTDRPGAAIVGKSHTSGDCAASSAQAMRINYKEQLTARRRESPGQTIYRRQQQNSESLKRKNRKRKGAGTDWQATQHRHGLFSTAPCTLNHKWQALQPDQSSSQKQTAITTKQTQPAEKKVSNGMELLRTKGYANLKMKKDRQTKEQRELREQPQQKNAKVYWNTDAQRLRIANGMEKSAKTPVILSIRNWI